MTICRVQAEILVHFDRTRPKQVNLRRAISAAYYALFHLLTASAAGNWRIHRQRADLSRIFEHGRMKGACTKLVSANADLKIVAKIFIDLQENRHLADYDNAAGWTRVEAEWYIENVRNAFDAWERVKNQTEAQDFLLSLFVPDRR